MPSKTHKMIILGKPKPFIRYEKNFMSNIIDEVNG